MSDVQNTASNGSPASAASQAVPSTPLWLATPELDVYESDSEFSIVLNVPGASPESVDVQVIGNQLSVRAERAPVAADVARVAFERHIELPSDVDGNSASARLRDGVLEIRIQKSAAARRVNIRVNAN